MPRDREFKVLQLSCFKEGETLLFTDQSLEIFNQQNRKLYEFRGLSQMCKIQYLPQKKSYMILDCTMSTLSFNELLPLDPEQQIKSLKKGKLFEEALQIGLKAVESNTLKPFKLSLLRLEYAEELKSHNQLNQLTQQLIETINFKLEPSKAISVLISCDSTPHLIQYLEKLHEAKDKTIIQQAHTNLLINCYMKTDKSQLKAFLRKSEQDFIQTGVHGFDVQQLTQNLIANENTDLAIECAMVFGDEMLACKLLIEAGKFKEVNLFMQTFEAEKAKEVLVNYGYQLMKSNYSDSVLKMIQKLCLSYQPESYQILYELMPEGWFDKEIRHKEAEISKMDENSDSRLSRTESVSQFEKTQPQTTFGNIFQSINKTIQNTTQNLKETFTQQQKHQTIEVVKEPESVPTPDDLFYVQCYLKKIFAQERVISKYFASIDNFTHIFIDEKYELKLIDVLDALLDYKILNKEKPTFHEQTINTYFELVLKKAKQSEDHEFAL
uniref:Vacuolar protein sorting 11 n=1 Tax=Trepomonas sp. PC1 TaxID=1076344 RepID=A0A146K877_9EUKA|eukprot:JAP91786.1 Vacuolar protein sorting 11 [Trepomonas sp. PC1]